MKPPQTTIIADDREANSAVVAALYEMERINLIIHRLKIGDYLINNNFLFERKTLIDFVASIKDGRLFQQTKKMANGPLNGALTLEGTASDLSGSRMTREAIQGALIKIGRASCRERV